jgi:hypothetical protein
MKRAALKIRRRKITTGYALTMSLVHNFRDPIRSTPTNKTLAYLGSIRSSDIPAKTQLFYDKLDAALDRLKGQISEANADAIRRKFQKVLPLPKVTTASRIEDIKALLATRGGI